MMVDIAYRLPRHRFDALTAVEASRTERNGGGDRRTEVAGSTGPGRGTKSQRLLSRVRSAPRIEQGDDACRS